MAEEKKKIIQFKNIVKSFEDGQVVLKGVSLDIYENEFVTLLGPSGCGKTTLLRILGGFLQPSEGKVLFDGEDIVSVPPYKREINTVFQKYALFPHMDVYDNIAFGLTLKKEPKDVIEQKVMRMLRLVSLEDYAHRNVTELSGGQQQRIGVLRALAASPPIVLMDEPFSALDPMTRAELQDEVHRLQLRFHKTIVFVTHDMDEAVKLADRICILQNGHVVQCDKPENILKHPANEYINSFIGKNRLWENPSFIRAEDIMRPRPITISQSRTVVQAVQLMRHYNIDSLLVTGDDNKFAGMVWLQDLIGIDQYSSPVSSFLSDDYLSVRVDDSLSTVLEKVADYGEKDFGILPVLDAEGAIRGFLNRSSLLSTLSRRFIDEPVERDEQEGA